MILIYILIYTYPPLWVYQLRQMIIVSEYIDAGSQRILKKHTIGELTNGMFHFLYHILNKIHPQCSASSSYQISSA